jgi:hypothetical protein
VRVVLAGASSRGLTEGIKRMCKFIVVKSLTRKYGYSIQAPRHITWATGPQNTFGWYRLKSVAEQRASVFNKAFAQT